MLAAAIGCSDRIGVPRSFSQIETAAYQPRTEAILKIDPPTKVPAIPEGMKLCKSLGQIKQLTALA